MSTLEAYLPEIETRTPGTPQNAVPGVLYYEIAPARAETPPKIDPDTIDRSAIPNEIEAALERIAEATLLEISQGPTVAYNKLHPRYNRDHNDSYGFPENNPRVADYLSRETTPLKGDAIGIMYVGEHHRPTRVIKTTDLRAAMMIGEAESVSAGVIDRHMARVLAQHTSHPHQKVELYVQPEELIETPIWETAFVEMTGGRSNLELKIREEDRAALAQIIRKRQEAFSQTPVTLDAAKAFWHKYKHVIPYLPAENRATLDYMRDVVDPVNRKIGENGGLFNGTAAELVASKALISLTDRQHPLVLEVSNIDYGNYYGSPSEQVIADTAEQLRQQGMDIGGIKLVNKDATDGQAADMPELRTRMAGAAFVRGRMEEDGSTTLVINYDEGFINTIKAREYATSTPFDAILLRDLYGYMERYDRVEMWLSGKDFYHPQLDCHWAYALEQMVDQQHAEGTDKKFEIVMMNRNLTEMMEAYGHSRAKPIGQLVVEAEEHKEHHVPEHSSVRSILGYLAVGKHNPDFSRHVGTEWAHLAAA